MKEYLFFLIFAVLHIKVFLQCERILCYRRHCSVTDLVRSLHSAMDQQAGHGKLVHTLSAKVSPPGMAHTGGAGQSSRRPARPIRGLRMRRPNEDLIYSVGRFLTSKGAVAPCSSFRPLRLREQFPSQLRPSTAALAFVVVRGKVCVQAEKAFKS